MTSSPTAWPDRSLTCLKLSRSISSTAPRVPRSRLPASSPVSSSMKRRRLNSQLSGSWSAMCCSCCSPACARRCPASATGATAGSPSVAVQQRGGQVDPADARRPGARSAARCAARDARPRAAGQVSLRGASSSGWAKSTMPTRAQQLLARDAQHSAELLVGLDDLARCAVVQRHDGHAGRRSSRTPPGSAPRPRGAPPPARGARSRRARPTVDQAVLAGPAVRTTRSTAGPRR